MEDSLTIFVEKIKEQLEGVDTSVLTPDIEFRKLDWWSSINALIILAHVNTEYGKRFTGVELKTCNTLRELYDFLLRTAE